MNLKTTMMAAGAALALTLMATAPAAAGPIPNGGVTVEDMVRFLQSKGYKAEIKSGTNGRYIASASSGINFDVYFYDCVSGRCASVQFEAGFDLANGITTTKINEWNRDKRFGRVAIGPDQKVWVSQAVVCGDGLPRQTLERYFGFWRLVMKELPPFIAAK